MAYKIIKGDLLETNADIICHQVNLQGVMGGGLALSIARKYPNVNKIYEDYYTNSSGSILYPGNYTNFSSSSLAYCAFFASASCNALMLGLFSRIFLASS